MKNIILIGFMGTGKSTIAQYLADKYSRKMIEMDQMIEEREGMSISQMFATHGEAYFREKEHALLVEVLQKDNRVISCGGGVVLCDENIDVMKKRGMVVWLDTSPDVILERVQRNDNRPVLRGKKDLSSITQMMGERRGRYEMAADIRVDTKDKSILQICKEIIGYTKGES